MLPDISWKSLRETRWVQALLVYLAGAWVALQVVTVFTQAFDWPAWVMRATIAVLAVGLVATLAILWARGHVRARERKGSQGEYGPTGHPVLAGVAAIALLLAGLALWALVREDGAGIAPGPALAGAAPGLAILPFHVNDPELDRWREGMVDLLSTNLDGAVGLRAIDSRTVLARWREATGGEDEADLATALGVARSAGGRYGLVGNVVSSGSSMRVTADVYDIETGESLGERQVEGVPDSIFGLVDRLSVEVVEVLLEREGGNLPDMDLARITTPSLTALKAFLDGESRLRRSDFEAAIPSYERAVEADSAFALAHYRLATAHGWLGGVGNAKAILRLEAARRHAERLPERERTLLDVSEAYYFANPDATERATEAVETYPDDPEASYLLGEVRFHVGYQSLATREMKEAPFQRALELDPEFGPGYIHLLDLAFQHADSAAGDTLLERYQANSATGAYDRRYETTFALAFGGDDPQALAALDSLPPNALYAVAADLGHPRFLDVQARVVQRVDEPTFQGHFIHAVNLFRRGRLDDLRVLSATEEVPLAVRDQALVLAIAFDTPDAREQLERFEPESRPPTLEHLTLAALVDLERGNRSAYREWVEEIDDLVRQRTTEGDSAVQVDAALEGLEGRALMLEGRDVEAAERLERSFRRTGSPITALWLASVYVRLGRIEDAIRVLGVMGPDPWLSDRLAPLHEQTGDTDAAIEAWSWRVVAWEEADPVLRDDWAHARSEIARLRGLQRT